MKIKTIFIFLSAVLLTGFIPLLEEASNTPKIKQAPLTPAIGISTYGGVITVWVDDVGISP